MGRKPYFPMFVDLNDKKIIIVGAGTIAKRRIRTMMEFAEDITVIAPEVNPELAEMENEGRIRIRRKKYDREDLYGADLVIAASGDPKVNSDIYAACRCLGITVNVCSDKTKCDFYFPRVVKEDHVVIGISSGGRDPKAARKTQEKIAGILQTNKKEQE